MLSVTRPPSNSPRPSLHEIFAHHSAPQLLQLQLHLHNDYNYSYNYYTYDMRLYKDLISFFLALLLGFAWGASGPESNPQSSSQLVYKELFPSSPHMTSSPSAHTVNLLAQTIQGSERFRYYWLLSHVPLPSAVATERLWELDEHATETRSLLVRLLSPGPKNIIHLPEGVMFTFRYVDNADKLALAKEVSIRVYEHLMQQLLQGSATLAGWDSRELRAWEEKYSPKLTAFRNPANFLNVQCSGEELKIGLHELAYFLNLLSFETSLEVLQTRYQQDGYSRTLVNILGDSLLDGGRRLNEFYEHFEASIKAIGYLPKDLQEFEGALSKSITDSFRYITGKVASNCDYDTEHGRFVKRMWRATCTLHLSAVLQAFSIGQKYLWDERFAPMLYNAIEEGSTEVFDSTYVHMPPDARVNGHDMLVEVKRICGAHYHVRQFNSGSGINNHAILQGSAPGSEKRYLGCVDMPELSEDQIKQSGYYLVSGPNEVELLEKLYTNKHLSLVPPTDPLLYERQQLAGTCAASSKMFYFRSFGLQGRLFEIDFKVELSNQLLKRIGGVQKNDFLRNSLLASMREESNARLGGKKGDADKILAGRKRVFEVAKVEEADQYIFLFPGMFTSLIASALNDILYSFYWIISNGKSEMATELFVHFLQQTKSIFESESPHAPNLLERVEPLIRDLHEKLLKDTALPFGLGPKAKSDEGSKALKDATLSQTKVVSESCLPFSRDRLPECFYHIIHAIYDFPYAPALAAVTLGLSKDPSFKDIPADLSFILLDAMRTVYKEDFLENDESMKLIAFAPKLDWSYQAPEGSTDEDCDEYDYDDILTGNHGDLARCLYLRNGPVVYMSLSKRIHKISQTCGVLTLAELPTCFYNIIRALREYSHDQKFQDATYELHKNATQSTGFKFSDTPPALAYLLLDAMRTAYGESYAEELGGSMANVFFAEELPWNYAGNEALLTENCKQATDEDIVKKWEWVAACRFRDNGKVAKS